MNGYFYMLNLATAVVFNRLITRTFFLVVLNRLLNTLKQSLQSSGVDLTQATISVQLDVAKGANSGLTAITSAGKVTYKLLSVFQVLCLVGRDIIITVY